MESNKKRDRFFLPLSPIEVKTMNDREFAEMLKRLVKEEEQRLQVGSPSFIRRDQEIMEAIDQAKEKKV